MGEFKQILAKGREIVAQQASMGKLRLELRSLEKDRRQVFERLGREAYAQLQDGAIPRLPGFQRPFEVLQELDDRIQALEEELGGL